MTVHNEAPADSGDMIADLADHFDGLSREDHRRLAAGGETVVLQRRPWARSLVWEDGRYVNPIHVDSGSSETALAGLDIMGDTGWVTYGQDDHGKIFF